MNPSWFSPCKVVLCIVCISFGRTEDPDANREALAFPPFQKASGDRTIAWGWWSKDDRGWYSLLERLYEKHLPVHRSGMRIRNEFSPSSPPIKKILHQIWLGGNPMPKQFEEWRQTCIDMHPSWMHVLWTESEVDELPMLNRRAFETAPNIGAKSDALRLEVLYRFGGIYLDTDFECLRPLDGLLEQVDFMASLSNVGALEISNGIIAAQKRHPIIKSAILTPSDALPPAGRANDLEWVGMATIMNSGPGRFTRVVMTLLEAADAAATAANSTHASGESINATAADGGHIDSCADTDKSAQRDAAGTGREADGGNDAGTGDGDSDSDQRSGGPGGGRRSDAGADAGQTVPADSGSSAAETAAAADAAELGRVVILPSNFFFPHPNSVVSLGAEERRQLRARPLPAETVALHHWAGSWLKHKRGVSWRGVAAAVTRAAETVALHHWAGSWLKHKHGFPWRGGAAAAAHEMPAEAVALHHWAGSWLKHKMGVPLWPPMSPRELEQQRQEHQRQRAQASPGESAHRREGHRRERVRQPQPPQGDYARRRRARHGENAPQRSAYAHRRGAQRSDHVPQHGEYADRRHDDYGQGAQAQHGDHVRGRQEQQREHTRRTRAPQGGEARRAQAQQRSRRPPGEGEGLAEDREL